MAPKGSKLLHKAPLRSSASSVSISPKDVSSEAVQLDTGIRKTQVKQATLTSKKLVDPAKEQMTGDRKESGGTESTACNVNGSGTLAAEQAEPVDKGRIIDEDSSSSDEDTDSDEETEVRGKDATADHELVQPETVQPADGGDQEKAQDDQPEIKTVPEDDQPEEDHEGVTEQPGQPKVEGDQAAKKTEVDHNQLERPAEMPGGKELGTSEDPEPACHNSNLKEKETSCSDKGAENSSVEKKNRVSRKVGLQMKMIEKKEQTDSKKKKRSCTGGDKGVESTKKNSNEEKAGNDGKKVEKQEAKLEKKNDSKKADKLTRARSAYIFFSMENRDRVKEENPDIKNTDIMKKLGEEWNDLHEDAKKKYEDMAAADKARSAEERNDKKDQDKQAQKEEKKKLKSKSKKEKHSNEKDKEKKTATKRASSQSKSRNAMVSEGFNIEDGEDQAVEPEDFTEWMTADDKDTVGDLEFVITKSLKGECIAKRKGMDYTQIDYEDNPAAKKAKGDETLHEEDVALLKAVRRYQSRRTEFKKELKKRTLSNGSLDLDDLCTGSPLEMLAFLGNMREDAFPPTNTKLPAPDVWMKVPLLGFSYLVQTIVDGERAGKAHLAKKLESAQARIKELQAQSAGANGAVEE